MKNILFAVMSLVIVGVCLNGIVFNDYDFRKTVVKVSGPMGHGSGSIVDSNLAKSLILTNRHVCDGVTMSEKIARKIQNLQIQLFVCIMAGKKECIDLVLKQLKKLHEEMESKGKEVTIKFNNLNRPDVKGKVRITSKDFDLCLVEIPIGQLPVIRISDTRAKAGDHILALGNPRDMTNHQTDGWVGDDIEYEGKTYQHITAEFYGGSSGSPTVNEDFEMVGVNTLGTDIPTQGYMVPLEDIKLFLLGNLIARNLSPMLFNMKL